MNSRESAWNGCAAYWRKQLAGLSALELPTDRPRPPRASYQGSRLDFEVPTAPVEELRRLSRREGTTLHMTLLAAFQVLLARYSGQDDIAVGLPIAGREHDELEPLIGFFVNMLVLRTDLSGQPTFRELLGRVRRVSLEAYDHQDLPFEKLVEELNPERHLSRHPLFQVMFQLSESAGGELTLPGSGGLAAGQCQASACGSIWRCTCEMQSEGHLRGTVVYSTDLFDAATIERMVGHFQTLLNGIVADPDSKIARLPLLTGPERRQLLVDWNDTRRDYPRDKCVHELFEEQAAHTPSGRRNSRRPAAHLPATRRAGEPVGAPPGGLERAPRSPGWRLHGAVSGPDCEPARHPQGRRRVSAA